MASVAIRLIHSSEAVQVLKAFQDKDLNRISFYGFFVARDSQGEPVEEKVMCNIKWEGVVLPSSSAQGNCCCEYHDVRTQLTWQCLKPPTLPCNTLVYHSMGEFSGSMTQIEGALTDKEIVDKWLIGDTRLINIAASDKTMRVTEPCLPGMPTPVPAGFYLNDVWTPFQCNLRQFTSDGITQCLSGKHIYITGDSTTRQWYYFFTENVPTLHEVDLHAMSWTGPFMAVDLQNNINLYYHPHGLPLRCGKAPVVTFQYLSNQIDNIAGGPHTVFILTMWAHFLNYPLSYYSYRVWLVRRAVVSLLRRAPETKVVIKTANTGFKDFYTGDWYAKQLDRILREAFRGINVYILDVWQMTACHYSSDDLHPQPVVIQNEMNILLSYICPN